MTNKDIAKLLKRTATLLELHEENTFKIRTYLNASMRAERLQEALESKSEEELAQIDGIGKSIAKAIAGINSTGSFDLLDELTAKTPQGILDMLDLKGLGPRKIIALWKKLNIQNVEELYDACKTGKVAQLKGVGQKTQESILKNLEYTMAQYGKALYAEAEVLADALLRFVKKVYPESKISFTGEMRRRLEVISVVEILVGNPDCGPFLKILEKNDAFVIDRKASGPYSLRGAFKENNLNWHVRFTLPEKFAKKLILTTGAADHLSKLIMGNKAFYHFVTAAEFDNEVEAYNAFGLPFIEPELREGMIEIEIAKEGEIPELIRYEDLRGTFHNHSNYSDGHNTIMELAQYCIEQGYEYLGISDHSKSAFYANGLREDQVIRQRAEIDELNEKLAPFRIFKGIESDILNDGSLDYDDDVLAGFDFVVASVHSNLNMDIDRATNRLLRAIASPYTTMLGHPTGRLLLRREGYPIDHKAVIDACAAHGVIIEINANPWRMDLDWRWVHYAIEKGVILSINPDAHEIAGFEDMRYGVYTGRKGGLTKKMTFNSWSLAEVDEYLMERKRKIVK